MAAVSINKQLFTVLYYIEINEISYFIVFLNPFFPNFFFEKYIFLIIFFNCKFDILLYF